MSQLDYTMILIFTLIIVVTGLSFGKSGTSMKSYFAAGGAVPWPISSLSLFMSFFSAGTFVVWGSIAYQYGTAAISIQLTMAIAGLLVGLIIAPAWRRSNSLTAAEFVTKRLGVKVQKFYSYLILLISLLYTGAFLYPVAVIINVSTGFPIEACIITMGILIIIYTVVGGLWAVMITDVLQFVVLTAAVLIVVPLSFNHVGGVHEFLEKAPAGFFAITAGEYSWLFLLAFGIYNGIFIGGNWAYVQRYTSVETPRSAQKVAYLFGALYIVSPFIWMLPPLIYRVSNPSLAGLEAEGAYLMMCKEVLPNGLIGLMLGGMIFATGSSVNTTLNLASAVFTNDIYRNFFPKANTNNLMLTAKIATAVFGVLTILVALVVPAAGGIVEIVLSVGAITGCSLYGPPIWALFSKVHHGKSILICTLLSLGINIYLKFLNPLLIGYKLTRAEEMFAGSLIPFILLFTYELYAKSKNQIAADYIKYEEILESNDIILEDKEESRQQNQHGLKVLGYALLAIGLTLVGLNFISHSTNLILILGLLILLSGFLLLYSAKKSSSL